MKKALSDLSEINWIHANNQTFNPNLKDLANADFTFVILRNPFDRLASVFLDKIVNREVSAWKLHRLSNQKSAMGEQSFRDFVNLISKPKFRNLDIHWRSQSSFLIYEEYDKYFQIENFSEITSTLQEKISFQVFDTRKSLKHDTSQFRMISTANFSETSANDILKMQLEGHCPSHESLYSPELKKIVRGLYSDDFEIFETEFGAVI